MLLEETPLPERVHRTLLAAEREAARTIAGWLRAHPEVRRGDLERAGFLVVQTVETLTHRVAAHPDELTMTRAAFAQELASMLEAYLTSGRGGRRAARRRTTGR
jgi:hypothetical protein